MKKGRKHRRAPRENRTGIKKGVKDERSSSDEIFHTSSESALSETTAKLVRALWRDIGLEESSLPPRLREENTKKE